MSDVGHEDQSPVEFVTCIRGREVSCRLQVGELHGDPELLQRLRRLDPMGRCRDAVSLALLVRDAVGSAVELRLVEERSLLPASGAVA
jgi:hypothetical protein